MRKLDGVESAKVSLNEGLVDIRLKPGNTVTVDQVRKVVRSNGFTPKAADVVVEGKLIERGGKPALEVKGLGFVYRLVDHHDAKGRVAKLAQESMGKDVALEGHVPETGEAPQSEPPVLEVLE
jgi:copper chaperone CopZ